MRNIDKNIGLKARGFTLVELAVVLVIIGLILGVSIVPLTAQRDLLSYRETEKSLATIREALIGFTVLYGRLPCPTRETDPGNANYGVEDTPCTANAASEGFLPWKTLGLTETDAWAPKRTQSTDPWNGYWRYRVDRNFAAAFDMTTGFGTDALTVQDSAGVALNTATERPVAIVFSAGKNLTPDGENADYEATNGVYEQNMIEADFDDQLIWLSRPLVISKMIAAGKLP